MDSTPELSPAVDVATPAPGGGMRAEALQRVLQLVDEHLNEPLHVGELARAACLSPFHFARMFKRSMGETPHAYVTRRRMEVARELLAASPLPIREVSRRTGFRTQAHFSGVFRIRVGMTPGEYRRSSASVEAA